MASVAVCNTGLMRTMLASAVVDGFAEHLVSPLEKAGFLVDTYLQVVGVWPPEGSRESLFIQRTLSRAYTRSTVSLLPVQLPKYRCPPNRFVAGHGFLLGTSDVLVQFLAIHDCYQKITQDEARRQSRHTHLMRIRTDLAYLSDIPISIFHDTLHVYVAASGMAPRSSAGSTCMNDHIFMCPRALCRSYFHMLELFQSEHCRSSKSTNESMGSIFATRTSNGSLLPSSWSGPPSAAFLVPRAPPAYFTAQWYTFARYTDSGRVCRAREAPATCCGLINEFQWWYTLATVSVDDEHGNRPSIELDCSRMEWSHRGRMDAPGLRASISECSARNSSQHAAEATSEWRNSYFMTTYRSDCARKWACSRADRKGVSHEQTILIDSTEGGSDMLERPSASGEASSQRQDAFRQTKGVAGRRLRDDSSAQLLECPANGDLANSSAFDAMLHARASPQRDVVLMLFGKVGRTSLTTGVVPIDMGWEGAQYIESLAARLDAMEIHNHLVVTAASNDGERSDSAVCRGVLQPLGLCCGWSSAGSNELRHNAWGWHKTHPHFLKLQLWWVLAQVLVRGYNAMTLDYDIHLAQNPFAVLKSTSFAHLGVVFAADTDLPEQLAPEGHPTRGPPVVCNQSGLSRAHARPAGRLSCACGRAPAPMINSAFCYARANPATAALFDDAASTIIKRLARPPASKEERVKNAVLMWEQDVLNEIVFKMARLPQNVRRLGGLGERACHAMDEECDPATRHPKKARKGTTQERWWLNGTHRADGVWIADALHLKPPAEGCNWGERELMVRTELVTASGHSTQLGLLPRSIFGRLCGRRRVPLVFYENHVNLNTTLPCSFYSTANGSHSFLGQSILHAQSPLRPAPTTYQCTSECA